MKNIGITINNWIMKRLLRKMKYSVALLITCLLNTAFALAQETQVLDSSLFECHYKCLQKDDDDLFVLRCGKNVSQFYSYYNNRDDSLTANDPTGVLSMQKLKNSIEHPNDKAYKLKSSIVDTEFLYYNWPIKGKLSMYAQVFLSYYRVDEYIPNIQWKLINDSVKYILGYKCQLAKTTFRGRDWYAWYTLDIPVGLGPWKLSGLPGLILETSDDKNFISFTAVSLKQHGIRPVMFLNYLDNKFEKITREKYLKAKGSVKYPSNTKNTDALYIELNEKHRNHH
jgi:GLPGLI family protein